MPHQGICPKGWRIPNLNDWNKLTFSLDKKQPNAQLKSTWSWENDNNGTNSSGFNAKASGYFPFKSEFGIVKEGYATAFWMADETDKTTAQYFYIGSDNRKTKFIKDNGDKRTHYACRCIKE